VENNRLLLLPALRQRQHDTLGGEFNLDVWPWRLLDYGPYIDKRMVTGRLQLAPAADQLQF
jgi:hypothetical protein